MAYYLANSASSAVESLEGEAVRMTATMERMLYEGSLSKEDYDSSVGAYMASYAYCRARGPKGAFGHAPAGTLNLARDGTTVAVRSASRPARVGRELGDFVEEEFARQGRLSALAAIKLQRVEEDSRGASVVDAARVGLEKAEERRKERARVEREWVKEDKKARYRPEQPVPLFTTRVSRARRLGRFLKRVVLSCACIVPKK